MLEIIFICLCPIIILAQVMLEILCDIFLALLEAYVMIVTILNDILFRRSQ